jgi:hypothetical protein
MIAYGYSQVCSGALSLADAQRQIATNWLAAYRAGHGTFGATAFTLGPFLVDD